MNGDTFTPIALGTGRSVLLEGRGELSMSYAPVKIYDEQQNPVQIHISSLATGP